MTEQSTAKKSVQKNPRREKPKYAVEVWGGTLFVKFDFRNRDNAEEFFLAALESESVTSCVMFIDGKFNGARDGAGS